MATAGDLVGGADRPRGIVTVAQDETAAAAAEKMRNNKIGCLVVTGPDGGVVGILTERDLVGRVLAPGADPPRTPVRDIMTRPVVTCAPRAPLEDVRRLMSRHRIRHVALVDDGLAVGMISSREVIARQLAEDCEMRNLTIFALAKLAESRDPETGTHLERVRDYTRILAEHLSRQGPYAGRLDEHFVELIYVTSPLHDIGKVSIPDSVLLKPARLDDAEFEIMKTHAEKGAETLDLALREFPEADFLRMARDIAACHHERIDGAGYPRRLAGEDIPLAARIFALADVYDALVSRRVYKEGFTQAVARNIILEACGTQFDSDVVGAFLECESDFIDVHNRRNICEVLAHECG